jgi:hypothetical protein
MRKLAAGAAVGVMLAVVAGCGAAPHDRAETEPAKRAATTAQALSAVARYAVVRADSARNADVGRLADVEAGSLLRIEGTGYRVARVLGSTPGAAAVAEPSTVWSGTFAEYPLWFAAVTRSQAEQTQVVLVFVRASSTDPWRVVMAPRLAADTELPDVRVDDSGAAAAVTPDEAAALSGTPTTLARRYAEVLTDTRSPYADLFEQDSFITQMRQLVQAQPRDHVAFRQTWTAQPIKYALRLADGGLLMFLDLRRVDAYRIEGKHALGFAGSPAQAFFPEPVHHEARLVYEHEVLLLAPAGGKALAIGQFGGLVSATGA